MNFIKKLWNRITAPREIKVVPSEEDKQRIQDRQQQDEQRKLDKLKQPTPIPFSQRGDLVSRLKPQVPRLISSLRGGAEALARRSLPVQYAASKQVGATPFESQRNRLSVNRAIQKNTAMKEYEAKGYSREESLAKARNSVLSNMAGGITLPTGQELFLDVGALERVGGNKNLVKKAGQKAKEALDPLIQEARKYKSAEEFVSKQPNLKEYSPLTPQQTERSIKMLNESGIPVKSGDDIITLYHGTNAKGVKGINESGTLNPFSYLATDKNASKGFVFGKGGDVLEIKVPVKDAGFVQQSMAGSTGATIQNPVRLVKGKDGIWRAEEWMSKSQLTDIWNQATKGAKNIPKEKLNFSEFDLPTYQPTASTPRAFENLQTKQKISVIKQDTMEKAKAIYDNKVAKIKDAKEILAQRRGFIKAIQKQFGLSDSDLRSITKKDIRLMSNVEFKTFLDNTRTKSEELAGIRQARNELTAQVQAKELDIEPLRQSLELPPVSKMSIKQLREMDDLLTNYQKGDTFLSKKKLETINRTELAGIRTYREAQEHLAKKIGVKPEELNNIKVSELDRFRGDVGLAERNPFYKAMVEETATIRLNKEAEFLRIEKQLNNLARKLETTWGEKLIPQQKNIKAWFEAADKSTVKLTQAETDVVNFMVKEWSEAFEYLVANKALSKGITGGNYFTHIRRGVLEAVKEDGFTAGFKELLSNWQIDKLGFDVIDDTGKVLSLDKFFKFAMRRTGELKATDNIIEAFRVYMRTFKTKQALDEIAPLIDTYAHALTPKGLTKEGLLLHGNIQRFVKEWINTQKGRHVTAFAKQGGKLDIGLRAGKAFTTLLDLGLNIPVTVASQIGEQAVQFKILGNKKYLLAKARAITPKGRRITNKYRNLIGKNPWGELVEPMRKLGDRFNEGLFVLFRDANVRRNRNVLLGSLSPEEWASETLSPQRLTALRMEIGRYGVLDEMKSIVGATPEAKVFTQYKSWAIPILTAEMRNFKYMAKYLASRGKNNPEFAKRAAVETVRSLEILGLVTFAGLYISADEDDDSFAGKLRRTAKREALTLYGALDPTTILTSPRLLSFSQDVAENLMKTIKLEKYQESKFGEYEAGDLKGIEGFKNQFTPRAIKQFQGEKKKELKDIADELLRDMESGYLTVEAAQEKFENEVQKLEARQKKERFALPIKEYAADLTKRIENEEITVDEAMDEFSDYSEKNVDSFESKDEGGFIDKVILYSKAIGVDPVTAFQFIFTNEQIRRIDNGTIIVKRMPFEESQTLKKQLGGGELILDHTLPLQLGGSNSKNNLRLVTPDEWAGYTPVENYLGDKLRAGLIDKKEAQKLIMDFKNGKISAEEIMN